MKNLVTNQVFDEVDPWQQDVDTFLGEHAARIYTILQAATNAGPFDGGCAVFAQALQCRLGGHIYVLADADQAQHAVLFHDGVYWDAGGPGSFEDMCVRLNDSASRQVDILCARPMQSSDLVFTTRNLSAARCIAALLPTQLDRRDEPVECLDEDDDEQASSHSMTF